MDEETSAGRVVGKEGLRALARLSEAPPRGSGPEGPCQWLAPGCMAHRDGGGRGRLFFFFIDFFERTGHIFLLQIFISLRLCLLW